MTRGSKHAQENGNRDREIRKITSKHPFPNKYTPDAVMNVCFCLKKFVRDPEFL